MCPKMNGRQNKILYIMVLYLADVEIDDKLENAPDPQEMPCKKTIIIS